MMAQPRSFAGLEYELAYRDAGSGPAVLLLHGLGSSGRDWAPQWEALRDYRVLAPDLRGHGGSGDGGGAYRIVDVAGDLARFVKEVIREPVHVIGLSLGGMVGLQLALDHPDQVSSLAVVNAVPHMVPETAAHWRQLVVRLTMAHALPLGVSSRAVARRLFPHPGQDAQRRQFVQSTLEVRRRSYLRALRAIVGWTVADRLGELRCPVQFIAGEHDYTPLSIKRRFAAMAPHATVRMILGSGHATPIDRAQEFNRAMVDFLERSCARAEAPGIAASVHDGLKRASGIRGG